MKLSIGFKALLLAFLAAGALFGQAPENVRVSFSMLSWNRTINQVFYEGINGEVAIPFIPNGAPTKNFEYYGPLPVYFYQYDGVDAEGNPLKKVIGSFTPRANANQLLIFIPDEQRGKGLYRILPLNFARNEVADGTYQFFNLASYPLYVRFGKDQFKVPAGKSEAIVSNPEIAKGLDVAMALQVSEAPGGTEVVYSAGWTLKKGRSALVFITNDQGTEGSVDVKRIYF
ncbi:hypothetical protein [Cerasicoccus fimbriatus]|uniref:hypothetical protein n=1 Tax=Cerasicoccus fimbriatus TaxID=3014554 RepID=UPI0022B465C1|nr:hypothetical protein [Cerasicoccus sp. TK19100]